jgi:hypothetical protein
MTKKARSQRNLLIGDVLEIHTKKGLAYAQCTHKVPFFGHLIRVLPGFHKSPIDDVAAVVPKIEKYVTFIFWDKDVDRSRMHVIGRAPVPERCAALPLFKDGSADPKTGKVATWWLWDGQKEWRVGKLTAKQKELPMRLIMNYVSLIHRIDEGWHPRDEA